MRKLFLFIGIGFLTACSAPSEKPEVPVVNEIVDGISPVEVEQIDYESQIDSVLYQALFKWNANWIGIAEFYDEKKDVNLFSLQLLQMNEDSTLDLISQTETSFDGLTFYPTFFNVGDRDFILANTGAQETWGNKIYELKGTEFIYRGFIDAAATERNNDDENVPYYHRNIAKNAIFTNQESEIQIHFKGDSVVLFDDQKGAYDVLLGSNQLRYILSGEQFLLQTNY